MSTSHVQAILRSVIPVACILLQAVGCLDASMGNDAADTGVEPDGGGRDADALAPDGHVADPDGGFELCGDDPRLCEANGSCAGNGSCYGGICLADVPPCMQPGFRFNGAVDSDLEPNNRAEWATTLPCGNAISPSYDPCVCPALVNGVGQRKTYVNGLMGLAICPAGDLDTFRFYLFAGETLQVELLYHYEVGGNLELTLYTTLSDGSCDIKAQSLTLENTESIEHHAEADDWLFLVVHPAHSADMLDEHGAVVEPADLNSYVLSYVLNSKPCDYNGVCDPYETNQSCSADCPDATYCPNRVCEPSESSCPADCYCGNGTCDPSAGEDTASCPVDCPSCSP